MQRIYELDEGIRPYDYFNKVMGGKWKPFIIRGIAFKGFVRFNELTYILGVSPKVLKQQLDELEKSRKREISDKRLLRNLNAYLRDHPNVNIDDIENLEVWRTKNDVGKARLKQLIEDYRMHGHVVFLDEEKGDDARSLDEVIEDKNANVEKQSGLIDEEGFSGTLEIINDIYLNFGNNTAVANRIRAVFATNKVALGVHENAMLERAEKLEFFDKEIYDSIIEKGKALKKKEIADLCGSTAANVTKITQNFWEEVEKQILKKR